MSTTPILASISSPLDQAEYPLFGAVPVHGEFYAQAPLLRLELWVNGNLAAQHTPETASGTQYHHWEWQPEGTGRHTLYVKAVDFQGKSAVSHVVHIRVLPTAGADLLVTTEGNDSFESLAEEYDLAPQEIALANPGLPPTGQLPAGEPVRLPVPGLEVPAVQPAPAARLNTAGSQPALPGEPNRYLHFFGSLLSNFVPTPLPAAPSLQGDVVNCSIRLLINDSSTNENGFLVYRLGPDAGSFSQVASLQPKLQTGSLAYVEEASAGIYQYYVSAFNTSGESIGNSIQVSVPEECTRNAAVGRLSNLLGKDTSGFDNTYVYLSVNGGEWIRWPHNSNAFLEPDPMIDLGQFAGGQEPSLVLGEAWGWRDGKLHFLGLFGQDNAAPPDHAVAAPSAGLLAQTVLETRHEFYAAIQQQQQGAIDCTALTSFMVECNKPWSDEQVYSVLKKTTFRWTPGVAVQDALWQVSLNPFPENNLLNPPGVVLSGYAPGLPSLGVKSGETRFLDIDLSQVSLETLIEVHQQGGVQDNQMLMPFPMPWDSALTKNTPQFHSNALVSANSSLVDKLYDPHPGLRRLYVRIIPINNGLPAGLPSNTNVIYYDFQKQIPTIARLDYQVEITDFHMENMPHPAYQYCVEVTWNQYPKDHPFGIGWQPGDVKCPKTKSSQAGGGGFISDLGKAFESAIKWATNKAAGLYNGAVEFVTKWSEKLNPLCMQAKGAANLTGTAEEETKKVCAKVAETTVKGVMAAYGLPPSLPDYETLKQQGKEYLVKLAAEEIGVECGTECQEFLGQQIDGIWNELSSTKNSSPSCNNPLAEHAGYIPMCPVSWIEWRADPRGQYAPAIVTVRVTRPPDPDEGFYQPAPDAKACQLQAALIPHENNHWPGKSVSRPAYIGGVKNPQSTWQGQKILGNALFDRLHATRTVELPMLAPGESFSIPVLIYSESHTYGPKLPGTEMYDPYMDWMYVYHGMSYTLWVSCGGNEATWQVGPFYLPYWNEK
ncbi:MAG: hypothetical protein KF885_11600 [Anaerolineales bacterium]|nr:hypothetical protein [Anaerolineales bacterium]